MDTTRVPVIVIIIIIIMIMIVMKTIEIVQRIITLLLISVSSIT